MLIRLLSRGAVAGFLMVAVSLAAEALATQHTHSEFEGTRVAKGLFIPEMNADRGRELFASKGCVLCHSVNDVGGHHTPLDAATMSMPMNAFEFAAKMWRGAEAMTFLQREDLGYVIDLTGEEFAAIAAFVHEGEAQSEFSWDDIPPDIQRLMMHRHDDGHQHDHHHGDGRPHQH